MTFKQILEEDREQPFTDITGALAKKRKAKMIVFSTPIGEPGPVEQAYRQFSCGALFKKPSPINKTYIVVRGDHEGKSNNGK